MDRTLEAALETFVAAAQNVVRLSNGMASAGPSRITARDGGQWSRRLRTSEAAAILGVSENALRRQIRANIRPDGTATFDGVHVERLGKRYLVRLSRRWVTDPTSGDAA